mmetsp:Transcript_31680/g.82788  ORF Transcript_31680/g.82788 Transcript_31680/m.82788 type:complete len:223 (+) Transcript_31680:2-670(+)
MHTHPDTYHIHTHTPCTTPTRSVYQLHHLVPSAMSILSQARPCPRRAPCPSHTLLRAAHVRESTPQLAASHFIHQSCVAWWTPLSSMSSTMLYARLYSESRAKCALPVSTSPAATLSAVLRYSAVCFQCVGVPSQDVLKTLREPPTGVASKTVSKWRINERSVPAAVTLIENGDAKSSSASVIVVVSMVANLVVGDRSTSAGTTSTEASLRSSSPIVVISNP